MQGMEADIDAAAAAAPKGVYYWTNLEPITLSGENWYWNTRHTESIFMGIAPGDVVDTSVVVRADPMGLDCSLDVRDYVWKTDSVWDDQHNLQSEMGAQGAMLDFENTFVVDSS